uniref:Uncharacterized protein n=1 Tax=Percolomonas cosmopolitus TaxID=63605 RepID=A0A7S1PGT8_9EUKA|mmetsp:Transcript_3882/g.14659  ORF Transcript_3882/g.14659 Transcript_3882/m.14659 type:complete len:2035 (+) Transcript_3882:358-6462(+)|eukprot:CAMPEP_0117440350 /NCGR_PEP_ID=MMETSP0759-20121206/3043_1 /TAXON_ID=63605 /ORGANISM="Percolomonas cosmopolitus, Strain WS" /LENGTH=2034 /DNA_ID=CAMNT_0005232109 /DNA_START=339 /DNA_END=6443 /DNA_ORIENTATION=-
MELIRHKSKHSETSSSEENEEEIYVDAEDWEEQLRGLNVPKNDIEGNEDVEKPEALTSEVPKIKPENKLALSDGEQVLEIDAQPPETEDPPVYQKELQSDTNLLSELDEQVFENDPLLLVDDQEQQEFSPPPTTVSQQLLPKSSLPNLVLDSPSIEDSSSTLTELAVPRYSLSTQDKHTSLVISPNTLSVQDSLSEPISPLENAQYDADMENLYDNVLAESLNSPSEFLKERTSTLSRTNEAIGVEFVVLEGNQLESSSIIPVEESQSNVSEATASQEVSSQHLVDSEIHPSEILYLSQVRTRPSYIPEYLRNEKDFLHKRANQEIPRDSFFHMLQQYLKSCEEVTIALSQGNKLWNNRETNIAQAYKTEKVKIESNRATCPDGRYVKHTEKERKKVLDEHVMKQLHNTLLEHRNLFYNYINARKLDSSFCREKVKSHLDCLFRERPFFTLHTEFVQSPLSPSLEQEQNLASLKDKTSTLFYFEALVATKKTSSASEMGQLHQFRDDCRAWIKQCISHLITFTNVDDQRFILVELMKCRGIGIWGANLLHISELHTDDDVDTFLAVLSLFMLTPFHFRDKPGKFILTESDFENLFNQFHFPNLIQYLVDCCSQVGNLNRFNSWKSVFQVIDSVVFILSQSLKHFSAPKYNAYSRKIAQTITSLYQILRSLLEEKDLLSIREVAVGLCKLFVKCYYGILDSAQNGGSTRTLPFLAALPMSTSPKVVSFSVFLSCFVGHDLKELIEKDIEEIFTSLDSWKEFAVKYRASFHRMFSTTESNLNCSAWIAAFSQMGIQSSLLAEIITIELFHLMFLNPHCEEYVFKESLEALYDLCCCHPQPVISLLVGQLILNHKTTQYDCFKLLRRIPLVLWNPSMREVNFIMISLQSTLGELEFNIAKYIISHLYYPDLRNEVSKNLLIHIVECLQSHFSRGLKYFFKKPSSVQKEKQFHAWVVDVLVRIIFCTPVGAAVFEPLSPEAPILEHILDCINDSRYSSIAPLLTFVLMLVTTVGFHLEDFHKYACSRNPNGWMRKIHSRPDEIYTRCIVDTSLRLFSSVPQSSNTTLFPLLVETLNTSGTQKHWEALALNLSRLIIMKFDTLMLENQKDKAEDYIIFWMQELLSDSRSLKSEITMRVINSLCKACFRNKTYKKLLVYLSKYHFESVEAFSLEDPKWSDRFSGMLFAGFPSNLFRASNKKVFGKLIKPQCAHPYLSLLILMVDAMHLAESRQQMGQALIRGHTMPDVMLFNAGHRHAIFKVLAHCLALSDILVNQDTSRYFSPLLKLEDVHGTLLGFWKLFFDLFFECVTQESDQRFYGYQFLLLNKCAEGFFYAIETNLKALATLYGRISKKCIERENDNAGLYASYVQCYTSIVKWLAPFRGKSVPTVSEFCSMYGSYSVSKIVSCLREKSYATDANGMWYDLMSIKQTPARESKLVRKVYPSEFVTFPVLNRERTLSVSLNQLILSNPLPKPVPQYNNSVIFHKNRADILNHSELVAAKKMIDEVIREFFQSRERHNALDAHCTNNLLPHLYYCHQFNKTVTAKCSKSCSGPVKVQIMVEEYHMNVVVKRELEENTISVQSLFERDYISIPFSQTLLKLEACTEQLMRMRQTMSFVDGAEFASEGMEWFWFCCDIVEAAHNVFPAVESLIETMLQKIYKAYVEQSIDAAEMLLQRMLRNPRSISCLAAFFNPQICLDRWDILLHTIFEQPLSVDALLLLLRRFSVHTFVDVENSYSTDVQYTSRICGSVVESIVALHSSSVGPHAQLEIFSLYMDWIRQIMSTNVPYLYRLVVKKVMDHVAFEKIPTDLILMLTNPTLFDGKIDLSVVRLCSTVTNSRLMILRNEKSLYDRMQLRTLAALREFFRDIFKLLPRDSLRESIETPSLLFESACEFFGPFILENVDMHRRCILLPTSKNDQLPEFEEFVKAFAAVVQYLCAESSCSVLGDLLLLYVSRLRKLPDMFLDIYHNNLTKLEWEHALLSHDQISQVLTFFRTNTKKSTHFFLLDILERANSVNNQDIPNRNDTFRVKKSCSVM